MPLPPKLVEDLLALTPTERSEVVALLLPPASYNASSRMADALRTLAAAGSGIPTGTASGVELIREIREGER